MQNNKNPSNQFLKLHLSIESFSVAGKFQKSKKLRGTALQDLVKFKIPIYV
jgi:hypothetical protein